MPVPIRTITALCTYFSIRHSLPIPCMYLCALSPLLILLICTDLKKSWSSRDISREYELLTRYFFQLIIDQKCLYLTTATALLNSFMLIDSRFFFVSLALTSWRHSLPSTPSGMVSNILLAITSIACVFYCYSLQFTNRTSSHGSWVRLFGLTQNRGR